MRCRVCSQLQASPSTHVPSGERAELLVILRFRQLVKVSAIALKAPSDKGPSSVKARHARSPSLPGQASESHERLLVALPLRTQVFCNPIGLGIDTAKTEPASQILELDAGQLAAGCKLDLRFVLFQKVSSLALFFPANHEGSAAAARVFSGCGGGGARQGRVALSCALTVAAAQAVSKRSSSGWRCMA